MTKEEILRRLNNLSDKLLEEEKRLQQINQYRLAELIEVERMINFKIQEMIMNNLSKEELYKQLEQMNYILDNEIIYYQDKKCDEMVLLYCSALNGYFNCYRLICDYYLE